jgi:hypothetical protein
MDTGLGEGEFTAGSLMSAGDGCLSTMEDGSMFISTAGSGFRPFPVSFFGIPERLRGIWDRPPFLGYPSLQERFITDIDTTVLTV